MSKSKLQKLTLTFKQAQLRVIIWIEYYKFETLVPHTKFRQNRPTGPFVMWPAAC